MLSKIKLTLFALLTLVAIFALSSCGGGGVDIKYIENNIFVNFTNSSVKLGEFVVLDDTLVARDINRNSVKIGELQYRYLTATDKHNIKLHTIKLSEKEQFILTIDGAHVDGLTNCLLVSQADSSITSPADCTEYISLINATGTFNIINNNAFILKVDLLANTGSESSFILQYTP